MNEPAALTVHAAAALVFAPLLAAVACWFIMRARARHAVCVAAALLLLACTLRLTVDAVAGDGLYIALGGHGAPLGIEWALDGLTLAMLWLVQGVACAVNVYMIGWRAAGSGTVRLVQATWLLLWGGLNGLFMAADLFNIYVTLELISLAAVGLAAAGGGRALRAAMRYLLFALAGSMFFLLGVALAYAETGTLALRLMNGNLSAASALPLLLGLMIKGALFPVHGWLPAAHASAPAPASAVLSALVVQAGVYLLLRLLTGPLAAAWSPLLVQGLAAIGTAGVVYGSLQAFRQERLKLVIAYSTVAQLGYLLLMPALAGLLGWQGAVYHAAAHGFAKASMFLAAGNIADAMDDERLDRLAGLDRVLSGNLMVVGICGVSLAGLPPTGGFVAKWWLLSAALDTGQWPWAVAIGAGGLLTAAYVFRLLAAGMRKPESGLAERARRAERLPASRIWPPYALAFVVVALGFAAEALLPVLRVAAPQAVLP